MERNPRLAVVLDASADFLAPVFAPPALRIGRSPEASSTTSPTHRERVAGRCATPWREPGGEPGRPQMPDTALIVLAAIALFAAFVNGAIGYGFSSLTVPLALVFFTNRVLNPAVVVIEVILNLYVLFINLNGIPAVWKRVFPILVGLLPGIGFGSLILASLHPGWIKFGTYTVILPLILAQAAGWRRPLRSTWLIGLPFGTALGILYSVTTISGPPLAILFNNQGLVKNEFRAGLALVRVAESSVTAIVYYQLGLFIVESENILLVLIPSVLVGIPFGAYLLRQVDAETFRRICMSFDAWVI